MVSGWVSVWLVGWLAGWVGVFPITERKWTWHGDLSRIFWGWDLVCLLVCLSGEGYLFFFSTEFNVSSILSCKYTILYLTSKIKGLFPRIPFYTATDGCEVWKVSSLLTKITITPTGVHCCPLLDATLQSVTRVWWDLAVIWQSPWWYFLEEYDEK